MSEWWILHMNETKKSNIILRNFQVTVMFIIYVENHCTFWYDQDMGQLKPFSCKKSYQFGGKD